jgi:hypothetical protein
MKTRPELHAFVKNKISGLNAQVYKHFVDNDDCVGVIVLPQPGAHGSDRYKKWRIDEIETA